jgi:predicted pyridoxine 5'-phosphate oxidase superfamily flavin-nucleotide-binding protein
MADHASSGGGVEPTFHAGEVELQREVGVAERMARIGPQVIRDHLPEQHRAFFGLLPFVIVGSVDATGQPTASLLAAPTGFVSSPDPTRLRFDALPSPGDPLFGNLEPGAALGVLGIQPHTRRRNRANGVVLSRDGAGFDLGVQQSFGNCPKYIQPREAVYVGSAWRGELSAREGVGERERELMARADTFFLASAHPGAAHMSHGSQGVDVSHRGGPPGFVSFTGDSTFVIPDFKGNNFFNTLGNLRLSTHTGLLFMDFVSGDVLQIDAVAEIRAESHPFAGEQGTGRVVHFEVKRSRWFPRMSPLRFLRAAGDAT